MWQRYSQSAVSKMWSKYKQNGKNVKVKRTGGARRMENSKQYAVEIENAQQKK